MDKIQLGKIGEKLAVEFLEKNGYRIRERNFRTKFGEIDIVAFEGNIVCFIEVKTRTTDSFGSPLDAILRFKQLSLSRAALSYIKSNNLTQENARFDVITVMYDENAPSKIDIIKDAFELNDKYGY